VAGAVQGVFGAAGGASGGQDPVFVLAAAVEVEREAPGAGAAAVTQSTQRERLVVAELTVEVGERAAEPDVKAQLRPVLGGVAAQALAQRGLGGFRWCGITGIVARRGWAGSERRA